MGFSTFIFLSFVLFVAIINGEKFFNKKLMLDIDSDVAPYLRSINGRDVAILTAFKDFQIDIDPTRIGSLLFLYSNEKSNILNYDDLRCNKYCLIIFETDDGQKHWCEMGKGPSKCYCPHECNKFDFLTGRHAPYGSQASDRNMEFMFKRAEIPCPTFDYIIKDKYLRSVIRANVKCMDVSHTYVNYSLSSPFQDARANPPDNCIFGMFSEYQEHHPFVSLKPERLYLDDNKTHIYLYSSDDLKKVPNTNITFIKDGWPRLPFHRKIPNQRYTLIKPQHVRNFPGFIFDYDNFRCNNGRFSIRLFDREECTIYFQTTIDKYRQTIISAGKMGVESQFYLNTNITEWIMYYNSPNIRFSDNSMDEFYKSTDFYLCEQKFDERFVIEIFEIEFFPTCSSFGLITGPEVLVEIMKADIILPTPNISSISSSNETNSTNETTTIQIVNHATVDPLIFALLTVALLIFISVTNFFLIRRKWFKESRTTLILDAFEKHWQYIIPTSELNNE